MVDVPWSRGRQSLAGVVVSVAGTGMRRLLTRSGNSQPSTARSDAVPADGAARPVGDVAR